MAANKNKKGPAATFEDIQSELRDDLARLVEEVTKLVSDSGSEALSDVKTRIQRIKDGLDDVVTEKGREATDAAYEIAETLTDSLEEALCTRPLTTLGIAVGVGFLFGTTWRR